MYSYVLSSGRTDVNVALMTSAVIVDVILNGHGVTVTLVIFSSCVVIVGDDSVVVVAVVVLVFVTHGACVDHGDDTKGDDDVTKLVTDAVEFSILLSRILCHGRDKFSISCPNIVTAHLVNKSNELTYFELPSNVSSLRSN